ncbi:MAG: ATP-binding protein [Eubacteriales bacterium]|nr:ATP-binding protein [Eubacteriales bacterium]
MKIPKRVANTLMNALKGGVVPRIGLPYIAVGREDEINAFLHDIDIISEGGASFRFISGKYGSGKSFLLQMIRNYCMDKGFVVMDADLSPERRLQGTKGQGLATYKELITNLATKTCPEGGALPLVLDRWIGSVQSKVAAEGMDFEHPDFSRTVQERIFAVISSMNTMVHGFDFARVLTLYFRAYQDGDDEQKARVLKWFRGEYPTKTEAKKELGVSVIITDEDWYEYIKLFSAFFCQAGYSGLLVFIDELVNIYKIPNAITRQNNYEKILTMYNDTLQGKASYLGIVLCGTPQCIEDQRRGIYSYEALRSRLTAGRFSTDQTRDLLAPIIRLTPLSLEEMLVLTEKLSEIHASLFAYDTTVTLEDRMEFLRIEYGRVGSDSLITPREIIRDYIELLDILYQNPELKIADILASDSFSYAKTPLMEQADSLGEYAEFEL